MENITSIDIGCLFAIVVKDGDRDKIASLLQLRSLELTSWKLANQKKNESEKFDKNGGFEVCIISDNIFGWNFIICNKIYDFKYSLNCCNLLRNEFEEIYSFVVDIHSGDYRFMKIFKGEMKRLFERDANQQTGEFGEELPEEKQIERKVGEHGYFHVVELAQLILKQKEWKGNKKMFEKPVVVGKRYSKEIAKYPKLHIEMYNPKEADRINEFLENDDDLPF